MIPVLIISWEKQMIRKDINKNSLCILIGAQAVFIILTLFSGSKLTDTKNGAGEQARFYHIKFIFLIQLMFFELLLPTR